MYHVPPLLPDRVLIVSLLFRRCVIFACISKLFIFYWLQSSILRNMFSFKHLRKKEGGVGYLFWEGMDRGHPRRVEGIEGFVVI